MDDNNANAPLDLIRRKERELAERLKHAENRAGEKVAEVRGRAAEIRKEAESAGQREAEGFFHDGITRAKDAAAAIRAAAERDVAQLECLASKHLDRAAQIVIDFVFPK